MHAMSTPLASLLDANPRTASEHRATAIELLDDVLGLGALNLEAIELAADGVAVRTRRRAVVIGRGDVVATGLGVELHPVARRRAADDDEAVFAEVEQDGVADDMAAVRAGHELLGLVRHEALHAVDSQIRDQLQRVRAFDEQIDHVVGLVEQHGGIAPGALLVAPVGELGGDHRVDIGADLRVAQVLNCVASGLQDAIQILMTHVWETSA